MATKIFITPDEWGKIHAAVFNRGKTLMDEAMRLGIDYTELIKIGNKKFTNSKQWRNCLKVSNGRLKKQSKQERKPDKKTDSPTSVSTTATATSDAELNSNPLQELINQKKALENEMEKNEKCLENSKSVLSIRAGTLKEAQAVLEKAQLALRNAEEAFDSEISEIKTAREKKASLQEKITTIEKKIEALKEQWIFLVDPWFKGTLPAWGRFISTAQMEGVEVQEVPSEYLPEASLDGVLLFDYVPDYKTARVFCGLVAMYELEGWQYELLISDKRLKALLEMYI